MRAPEQLAHVFRLEAGGRRHAGGGGSGRGSGPRGVDSEVEGRRLQRDQIGPEGLLREFRVPRVALRRHLRGGGGAPQAVTAKLTKLCLHRLNCVFID